LLHPFYSTPSTSGTVRLTAHPVLLIAHVAPRGIIVRSQMTPPRAMLLALAALATLASVVSAATTNQWRTFTVADGLPENACVSVTLGASGNVLVRHPHTNVITLFDGYEATVVPAPGIIRHRVYESPGGQLWTFWSDGLLELRNGTWLAHPVPQIASLFAAGRTNEVALLPVRQGHVLILVPDELLQLTVGDSGRALIEVVRHDGRTAAEQFNALKPRPDNTEWRATASGLLRRAPEIWQPGSRTGVRPVQLSSQQTNVLDISNLPPNRADAGPSAWPVRFTARNGDLWLGGVREIAWQHRDAWRIFSSTNQMGPENIIAFAEAPDGRVWCATPDRVWEFDGRNWLGMRGSFNHINALLGARDGTLWVAAENGVHHWTRGAWIANGIEDGLPSASVPAVSEDATGLITAHTVLGDSTFSPEADSDAPQTFALLYNDRTNAIREGAIVTLMFHGRDRWKQTAASHLLFSYRLDEREWSPFLETAEVSFGDLSLGRHYFQVRAMDRAGNVDPHPARLEFTIAAPWFRQPQLVILLATALVVVLFFAALALNRHRRLRHSYAEVERLVAERTRELELAHRELAHSQKMNALGTLAAGIAHDFNNILSIIKGSAQIIEDNPDNPEKIRTRTARIQTVVQQGAGIVEAMLGFSRGDGASNPARCDVNAVVDDTIKLLGDRFLRDAGVRFEPAAGLPEILVVRDCVQQILLNLIFNAAEAMPDRKQITVTTSLLPPRTGVGNLPPGMILAPANAPRYITIAVRDSGTGIAPENLPRIFEPFFTTKAMSARRGTGLGLSMVYELAKKISAGIAVETAVGQGSTFTIYLPVDSVSAAESSADVKASS